MGDRANVYVRNSADRGVYLYTHWGGTELPETVRVALDRGRDRWDDDAYLARILFREMIRGAEDQITGHGISAIPQDNEYPIIVLDCETQQIGFDPAAQHPPQPATWITFQAYCANPRQAWPERAR